MDYCDAFISCLGLILTAPIHCRASIDELMMKLMKKQTHQHLGWPEGGGGGVHFQQMFIFGFKIFSISQRFTVIESGLLPD